MSSFNVDEDLSVLEEASKVGLFIEKERSLIVLSVLRPRAVRCLP